MSKRKSNKQFKKEMFALMAEKFNCEQQDFWFDDGVLMMYEPPCGYSEGDELPFWWHGYGCEYASLTANQLKGL
ncbi:hypothetical protein [Vibrio phage XM1]|nr:hypothetical protein [Vibrio phage XM1]